MTDQTNLIQRTGIHAVMDDLRNMPLPNSHKHWNKIIFLHVIDQEELCYEWIIRDGQWKILEGKVQQPDLIMSGDEIAFIKTFTGVDSTIWIEFLSQDGKKAWSLGDSIKGGSLIGKISIQLKDRSSQLLAEAEQRRPKAIESERKNESNLPVFRDDEMLTSSSLTEITCSKSESELVPFGGNVPSSLGPGGIAPLTATSQEVTDVPSIYKPSGKTPLLAVILLLIAAGVLSPILGGLVIYLDMVASVVGSAMSGGEDNGMLMLIFFAVYMVIAISIGWISALVMTKVARLGKNRNSWISASAAGLAGMGGAIVFLQMRMGNLGVEAFDSNVDRLKALVYVVGMIISSFQIAYMWSKNQFFCEKCMKYMDLSFTRNFKVCHEDDLIKAMDGLQYENILALPEESLEKQEDTINLIIHTCDKCLDGIAELTTTRYSFIDHNKPESGKKSVVKRVASKRLPPTESERVIRYSHANSKG